MTAEQMPDLDRDERFDDILNFDDIEYSGPTPAGWVRVPKGVEPWVVRDGVVMPELLRRVYADEDGATFECGLLESGDMIMGTQRHD